MKYELHFCYDMFHILWLSLKKDIWNESELYSIPYSTRDQFKKT